jgi:hypothetical protein
LAITPEIPDASISSFSKLSALEPYETSNYNRFRRNVFGCARRSTGKR